mmetsp:Transcript_14257/g.41929  ORF Transcript_14257/g.41929 Transcript_14257/m.41929 type:complete len:260 (+) Transcript_14257:78-857(+)
MQEFVHARGLHDLLVCDTSRQKICVSYPLCVKRDLELADGAISDAEVHRGHRRGEAETEHAHHHEKGILVVELAAEPRLDALQACRWVGARLLDCLTEPKLGMVLGRAVDVEVEWHVAPSWAVAGLPLHGVAEEHAPDPERVEGGERPDGLTKALGVRERVRAPGLEGRCPVLNTGPQLPLHLLQGLHLLRQVAYLGVLGVDHTLQGRVLVPGDLEVRLRRRRASLHAHRLVVLVLEPLMQGEALVSCCAQFLAQGLRE